MASKRGKKTKPAKPARDPDLALLPGYDCYASAGDCWFDQAAADRACWFIENFLVHVKGRTAGKPFILSPWQRAIIKSIFGWKRPDGTRRYREVFIYVPRKNGKSFLIAAIILCCLFMDKEPGAELYSAAADSGQASIVFKMVKSMVLKEPRLKKRLQIFRNSIVRPDSESVYQVVSSDANTKHGFSAHVAVVDELHALPNGDLPDVLETSMGARSQPLMLYITTADFDRPSACNDKHDYASSVRDGLIEAPDFLPVIYEAKPEDDWTDPEVWRKANPNLGVSVTEEYLSGKCQKAKNSPAFRNTFLRLYLNVRTTNDVAFIRMEKWDKCSQSFPILPLIGRPCFGGLDLSTTTDITALALLFPPATPGELLKVLMHFWVPEETAAIRAKEDRVPYPQWIDENFIHGCPGRTVDYDQVRRDINRLGTLYNIRQIGTDRWNATQLIKQIEGDGFEIFPFGQGFKSMNAPTKELEKLILEGKFQYYTNKVLRWMAANLTTEEDAAGSYKPSKKKSTEKIDGMVALIEALGVYLDNPDCGSVYENRGLIIL